MGEFSLPSFIRQRAEPSPRTSSPYRCARTRFVTAATECWEMPPAALVRSALAHPI